MSKRKTQTQSPSGAPPSLNSIILEHFPDASKSNFKRARRKRRKGTNMADEETLPLEDIKDLCRGILDGGESNEADETDTEQAEDAADRPSDKFEELLAAEDFDGVINEADKLLSEIPPLTTLARAALARGKGILMKAMAKIGETGEPVAPEIFDAVWSAFELSSKLNPECKETQEQIERLSAFLKDYERMIKENQPDDEGGEGAPDYDVVIVGAGASGVGTAIMLTETFGLDKDRVLLVERGEDVGESFRRWPAEMRFISPSFNQQGWTDSFDLNSISFGSSPAYSLHAEHPSGEEYATYLKAIAETKELKIRFRTEVATIAPSEKGEAEAAADEKKDDSDAEEDGPPLFDVNVLTTKGEEVASETLSCHYVVWAAGEFQYKGVSDMPGAELCMHNSEVKSWKDVEGDDLVVIGGYESGVDACYNLAKAGKKCSVLASTPCWDVKKADPSVELAPYTAARLREVMSDAFDGPSPQLYAPLRVLAVEKEGEGYSVTARWSDAEENEEAPLRAPTKVAYDDAQLPGTMIFLKTKHRPILATGFEGSVKVAASHLFAFADDDHPHKGCLGNAPLLTDTDQSTVVPGLFLVGPQVQHDSLSFCFVYKFRQRFAVVANAICQGLGMDTKHAVSECHNNNMYLDDFDRCEDTCGDVC